MMCTYVGVTSWSVRVRDVMRAYAYVHVGRVYLRENKMVNFLFVL